MKRIIDAVDRGLLKKELNSDRFLRMTTKAGNYLFLVNHINSPNVLLEIGRLRELSFRAAGGGTGKEVDIDDYDTAKVPFEQLVVWDPEADELTSGYRLLHCDLTPKDENGKMISATSHLFDISDKFYQDYVPKTLELGRSFVQPRYQSRSGSKKAIFSLDNLWDGLGAVISRGPNIDYLFGKVTMYPDYNMEARNTLLAFLSKYFPDPEKLVFPLNPLVNQDILNNYLTRFEGLDYKTAYSELNRTLRGLGENIPPLINSYMGLSSTMKTFGTSLNNKFGDVEETGILVSVKDIYLEKSSRYIGSFPDLEKFTPLT